MAPISVESARIEPGIHKRQYFNRALFVAVGLLGVGLGVVLSIVTVVLPRRHELSRVRPASQFFRDFDAWKLMQSLGPLSGSSEESLDRDPWNHNRVFAKTYVIQCTVPAAEQAQLLQRFEGAIQGSVTARVGRRISVWGANDRTQSEPGGMTYEHTTNYQDGTVYGVVHQWAVGRGDNLRLVVSITEL